MNAEPIDLRPGEIHLWLAHYEAIGAEELLEAYRGMLNPQERSQEQRFYFARDRRRYRVTRALQRTVLSRYARIAPQDWEFSATAYGRPEIANTAAEGLRLTFNISHTHDLIVLAVTRSGALGVDVENTYAREACLGIADRYFSAAEVLALQALPLDLQQQRFWEYWTFKESYIKARGMGLSLPLDKFAFRFPDARQVLLEIQPELADDPASWELWQFRPAKQYLVALCATRCAAGPAAIVAREVVPLAGEKIFEPQWLRTSRHQS
jgi:4'-phosphopantetheinyl transferase